MKNTIRSALALGLVLLVLLSVWALLQDEPPVSPEPAAAQASDPLTASEHGIGYHTLLDGEAEDEPPVAEGPGAEAVSLVAVASGKGRVRCALPPDTPPLDRSSLPIAHREGDTLWLMVEQPEGTLALGSPLPPRPAGNVFAALVEQQNAADERGIEGLLANGRNLLAALERKREAMADWRDQAPLPTLELRWFGAAAGQEGICSVLPLGGEVELRVRVTHGGEPFEGVSTVLRSMARRSDATTDAQGTAHLLAVDGMTARVLAVLVEPLDGVASPGPGDFTVLRGEVEILATDGAVASIELEFDETNDGSLAMEPDDTIVEMDREAEPLHAALNQDGLSDEARALVRTWLATHEARVDRVAQMLDDADAFSEGVDDAHRARDTPTDDTHDEDSSGD